MSSILLPSTRISAPAGFVDVDHLNQFSSGLSGGFLLPRTSINGRAINSTLPVGVDDQYSCFISNSSSGVVTIPDCFSPQTSGVTIYILAKRYGAQPDSGFGTTFILEKVSGVQVAFCHFIKDSGERVRFDTTSDDDSSNLWETSVDWPVGQWQVGAYVFSSGFEPKFYRNGVVQTLSSSAGAISGTLKPSVAGQVNLSGLRLNGAVAGVLVFSSAHSSNRIYDFSKNIWQIEKKHLNRIWFDMGAASGGAAALEGSASGAASAFGSLTTGIPIAGAALAVASASGALSVGIPLAGAAASMSTASGSLTAQITLAGSALAQAVSAALLSTGIVMTAAAVAQAAADGTLDTAIALLGDAQAQAGGSGSLTTGTGGLEGNAQASASASASLSTQIRLSGAAIASAGASGSLGGSANLAGTAVSAASASGELTVNIALTAQALASAIAQGSLTAQILLDADAAAQAQAGAALSGGAGFVLPAARSRTVISTARRPAALSTSRR